MTKGANFAQRLRRGLALAETGLLVALLAVMIGVAAYQIIARNFFGGGLVWGSDLVQVAMLWVTMIGAAVAAGDNRHIRIDIVQRFAGPRLQAVAARITALFAAALCGLLAWYAIEFVHWDFLDQVPAFAGVPAWICESIIPVAASLMALRYLGHAIWPPADDRESLQEASP